MEETLKNVIMEVGYLKTYFWENSKFILQKRRRRRVGGGEEEGERDVEEKQCQQRQHKKIYQCNIPKITEWRGENPTQLLQVAEKASDKIQHPFMIKKTLRKLE